MRETAATEVQTRSDISLCLEFAPELPAVCADESQMLQVVLNLMVNAADAMPHGGRLRVVTSRATPDDIHGRRYVANPGRYVRLTVADSGVGMDPGTCARIFEPFFTTKKLGRGTGARAGLGVRDRQGPQGLHRGGIRARPGEEGAAWTPREKGRASAALVVSVTAPWGGQP